MQLRRWNARWRRVGLGAAVLLAACKRAPDAGERHTGPISTASSPPLLSASAVSSASPSMPSALPPAGCAFNRGVSGALGGATVFLRVTRTGDALAGAYFYDDVTDDIHLAGRVEHETRFVLEESHSGAVTATFRGTCDGDGALRGDWTSADGKTRHAFILSIPSHATIGTRRQRLNVRTTDFVPPDESPFCELDRRFPVVLGLATGEIEREIQRTVLTNIPESIRDEETVKRTRACKEDKQTGFGRVLSTTGGFHVDFLDTHVLVLKTTGSSYATQSAHPALNHGAGLFNVDVKTGRLLRIQDAVVSVDRVLHYALTSCSNNAGGVLEFNSPAFSLRADGIGVVGTGYAYVNAYLMFQGPVISYAALLREGLLKPDFAEAALWASTAPAARGASPCVSVWQPE
jgi:hypothetical protein